MTSRPPRVLVVHHRYREVGGEERAVALQLAALRRAGIAHEAVVRSSAEVSSARAAGALLRGGDDPDEVARAVHRLGADVVHVHNMQPTFGPRALAAARAAGARVVLHLHNFRLFCAIGVSFRDGENCFRCRRRLTLPGLVLNCRGSLAESAAYTAALAAHQPAVLEAVDRFVTPSAYAAGQLERLGVPGDRLDVVANYLPAETVVERSRADAGAYAVVVGRLSAEKGVATAIEAAALSGVPLKVAGDGPLAGALREQVVRSGAPVELLGRVPDGEVPALLAGAAMALVPSVSGDVMPFSALEAMAAGLPVIAARSGSLPEVAGEARCVPRRAPGALAAAMRVLWDDPESRRIDGDRLIARARARFNEERFVRGLLSVYGRLPWDGVGGRAAERGP